MVEVHGSFAALEGILGSVVESGVVHVGDEFIVLLRDWDHSRHHRELVDLGKERNNVRKINSVCFEK